MIADSLFQARMARLCRRAVSDMALDLSGLRVLTEAATGPFAATAAIAALAGAEVVAVARIADGAPPCKRSRQRGRSPRSWDVMGR